MLNQAIDRVTDHSWIPSSAWRRLGLPEQKKFARKKLDPLDEIPAMSATVLGLEILLHEPSIDLRMVSELVLSDVGATIQILRLIGREYEFTTEHPCRMGDCLASLDAGTWFDAISARTFVCDREHAAISSLWNHCRLVAQYAQLVAESLEDISPEEAYLVGLLHEIGSIPKVLNWPNDDLDDRESASLLAMEGSLPLFVLSAIQSMNDPRSSSTWKVILTSAHELAGARPDFDPTMRQDFNSLVITPRWGRVPIVADCMLVRS
jgi:HDOD domain-containing protein